MPMRLRMTVKLQELGQSLVLVLDKRLLEDHRVDPLAEYALELSPEHISLLRLPLKEASNAWTFDDARRWVASEYAAAFRVLAR